MGGGVWFKREDLRPLFIPWLYLAWDQDNRPKDVMSKNQKISKRLKATEDIGAQSQSKLWYLDIEKWNLYF